MLPAMRPAAAALLLGLLAACAKGEPPSPQLAYCTELYQLYFRYHPVITFAHNGQRVRVELALEDCVHGNYAAGIRTLTTLLIRHRLTVPPPPSGSGE